jgi:hypothetical protein
MKKMKKNERIECGTKCDPAIAELSTVYAALSGAESCHSDKGIEC